MPAKIYIDTERLIELHKLGLSNSKIAKVFGVSYPTISKNLESLGLVSNATPVEQEVRGGKYRCLKCGNLLPIESYELNASGKSWRRTCKKCKNVQTVLRRFSTKESYISRKVAKLKAIAKKKDIPFNLDAEYLNWLYDKQNAKCFYTDEQLIIYKYLETPSADAAPSIDKLIPEKGYVKGNVVWCLTRVNRIKNNISLEEMQKWTPDWYKRIDNFLEGEYNRGK